MDFLTVYAIYMTVAMLVVGLWATRVPHEDVKIVFILAVAWPLTIVGIAGMLFLYAINWDFDIVKGTTQFGFRKPTNPNAKGWAVTVFGKEIQLYSVRRKTQAEINAEIDRLHK